MLHHIFHIGRIDPLYRITGHSSAAQCLFQLLFIFRFVKNTPAEWCSFAILLMNVVSPLIERVTMTKSFGEVKKNG